jgi:hypothetical protein
VWRSGDGSGLRGQRVAADQRREESVDAEIGEHLARRLDRLVGADAEGVAGRLQGREGLGDARVELRQGAGRRAVDRQEARQRRRDRRRVVRLAGRPQDALQQHRHAVADEAGDGGEVERLMASLAEEGRRGGMDVRHAVDQRAVEVEDHGAQAAPRRPVSAAVHLMLPASLNLLASRRDRQG